MSVADIKARVNAGVQGAVEASETCASARSKLDTALQELAKGSHGTNHSKPGEAENSWCQAQVKLDEALTLIRSGNQACADFVNTI